MKLLNSLRARLIIPVILISLTLLTVTIVFLGQRQLSDVRQNAINQARANLQMIADYASVPLIFDQQEDAKDVLSKVKNIKSVLSAAIYSVDEQLFVSYGSDSVIQNLQPEFFDQEIKFDKKSMFMTVPIIHRDTKYGTLVAEIDLRAQQRLIRELSGLFFMVFAAMGILAVIMTFFFERKFLRPILMLTEKFGELSKTSGFVKQTVPLPVEKGASKEIEILIAGYNNMAANLTLREKKQSEAEAALKEINEKLESKVADRTKELESTHDKLRKLYKNEKALVENLPYGIILIDYDLKVVEVNNFAKELLGYKDRLPAHAREFSQYIAKTNQTILDFNDDFFRKTTQSVFTSRAGEEIPVLRTAIPIIYNDQNLVMVAFVDITDLQNTQKELRLAKEKAEESDQLKSAFLANMSHEIRTPLNAIVGFTSMLIAEEFDQETKDSYIRIVEENTENLLNLIEDILDLSKLESGSLNISPKEVDMMSFCQDIYKNSLMMRDRMTKYDCEMKLDIQLLPEGERGFFDSLRIKQVVLNLINNALKFTDKGSVTFGIELRKKKFLFYVKDTGFGIDDKDKKHVFDRFYKSRDTKRLYKGTGLGLAICKSLVELSNGKIWLRTEPGKGTTFYFTLPRHSQATGSEPKK
jgi:PAS domain S-box-containing protein